MLSDHWAAQTKFLICHAGLLVPDIPLEETHAVRKVCDKHGIELVLLSTPTTPPARMAAIAEATQGFVYLVSLTGVTGVKDVMESRVEGLVQQLHGMTDKPVSSADGCQMLEPPDAASLQNEGCAAQLAQTTPGTFGQDLVTLAPHVLLGAQVCVGFGVSKPEQARQIASWGAEGVICGSALVRALGESSSPVSCWHAAAVECCSCQCIAGSFSAGALSRICAMLTLTLLCVLLDQAEGLKAMETLATNLVSAIH